MAAALATARRRSRACSTARRALPPPGDPTLAWAYAGPEATGAPGGRRHARGDARAPRGHASAAARRRWASEDVETWLARDPLRLAQVPWEARAELAAGVAASPGGAFVADEGRARLVLAEPRGSAFSSDAAHAVVEDVERAEAAAARPGVTTELAGGHAVAWATEQMLRRDLEVSGTLSAVLASLAFVVTFRRARALVAVLPPLVLGTLWTTGLAALFPAGLNALAIAFAAVVVGVGVDTGVHVYAALLDARRDGPFAGRRGVARARSDVAADADRGGRRGGRVRVARRWAVFAR